MAYADFESILEPVNEYVDVTQGVETSIASSTTAFQEHVMCSFVYKIVSSVNPDCSRPLLMYHVEDAAEKLARDLQQEADQLCAEYIKTPKFMIFSVEDSLAYVNTVVENRLLMIEFVIIATLLVYIWEVLTACAICSIN